MAHIIYASTVFRKKTYKGISASRLQTLYLHTSAHRCDVHKNGWDSWASLLISLVSCGILLILYLLIRSWMQWEIMMVNLQPCAMKYPGMSVYTSLVTTYCHWMYDLMFLCRRLHERRASLDRIECNITSEVPFSDATMTAVSSAIPFTTGSPIGW